jgi:hypothetical protein
MYRPLLALDLKHNVVCVEPIVWHSTDRPKLWPGLAQRLGSDRLPGHRRWQRQEGHLPKDDDARLRTDFLLDPHNERAFTAGERFNHQPGVVKVPGQF